MRFKGMTQQECLYLLNRRAGDLIKEYKDVRDREGQDSDLAVYLAGRKDEAINCYYAIFSGRLDNNEN